MRGRNIKKAAYPYILWTALFVIAPMFLVMANAFSAADGSFTTANFARAFEPIYLAVMWRSVELAAVCTAICLLLGYPAAYFIARLRLKSRGALLFLVIVPMWMNFLLRTYAWLTILEKNGVINSALEFLGLPKLNLLYNSGAVVLGMVYNFLPFMILPLYTVLEKTDGTLVEAAQDLGASRAGVFFRVTLPLSLPGVLSGVTMVFMPAVTTFVESNLLGGNHFILIGNLIEQQFLTVYDWRFGSALSVILMLIILISMGAAELAGGAGEET